MEKRALIIIITSFMLFSSFNVQAQALTNANNILVSISAFTGDGLGTFSGNSSLIFNPPRPVDGTVYIFSDWNNSAVIESTSGQSYLLKDNINFNAKNNVFQSKIGKDSIFTHDFSGISKVVIKNKVFKSVYSPIHGEHKVFQTIVENDDFVIYKDYYIDIKQGNPNPLLAQLNDKYLMRDSYYIKKGKSFKRFKMRKSDFMKLAGDKSDDLQAFVKKNKLNFKKDEDIEKIATFYASL